MQISNLKFQMKDKSKATEKTKDFTAEARRTAKAAQGVRELTDAIS